MKKLIKKLQIVPKIFLSLTRFNGRFKNFTPYLSGRETNYSTSPLFPPIVRYLRNRRMTCSFTKHIPKITYGRFSLVEVGISS